MTSIKDTTKTKEYIIQDSPKKTLNISNSGNGLASYYWTKCLDIIRDNVSNQVYHTWFEPLMAIEFINNQLVLQVPSQFYCQWIDEHYSELIAKALNKTFEQDVQLKYNIVVDEQSDSLANRTIKLPALKKQAVSSQQPLPFANTAEMPHNLPSNLDSRYTFDNYIVGDSNNLAYSAAQSICNNPGKSKFNLLFIYGKTGLGKTHLVQAIGNSLIGKYRNIKVVYTSGEKFYHDYLNAVQNNKITEFTYYYRTADVLIVDDIHFLSGKEKTQDNFFHTFNALQQAGRIIILTSDRHQKEIKDVDERLISRFQWGLTADIQKPDFEMRVALLRKKSSDEGLILPQDIIEYIAKNVTSHVRELEGVLISLFARITMDNRPLSLQLVKEIVQGTTNNEPKVITIDNIKHVVSSYYGIPIDVMESKLRKHEVALARQMCMYLAKHLTQLSLKSIGSHFGGRDHSTVLHSCQAIENYFVTDRNVKNAYEQILRKLTNEL